MSYGKIKAMFQTTNRYFTNLTFTIIPVTSRRSLRFIQVNIRRVCHWAPTMFQLHLGSHQKRLLNTEQS